MVQHMNQIVTLAFVLLLSFSVLGQKPNHKKELRRLAAALESLKISDKQLQTTISEQKAQIDALNKRLADAKLEIQKANAATTGSLSTVRSENERINDQVEEIGSRTNRRAVLLALFCTALAFSGIAGFLYLMKKTVSTSKSEPVPVSAPPESDLSKLAEQNGRDVEFLDVLTKTYLLLQERASADGNASEIADHRLPLKVGDEIHRMRKRIENMPQEIKGLGALRNSLNRLEEEFNDSGYQMLDLLGKQYNDGMRLEARFVDDPSIPKGSEIITDVLRPQIAYKDKVIQFAKVEVGKSY